MLGKNYSFVELKLRKADQILLVKKFYPPEKTLDPVLVAHAGMRIIMADNAGWTGGQRDKGLVEIRLDDSFRNPFEDLVIALEIGPKNGFQILCIPRHQEGNAGLVSRLKKNVKSVIKLQDLILISHSLCLCQWSRDAQNRRFSLKDAPPRQNEQLVGEVGHQILDDSI